MNYQVLARKWRPQLFNQISGQDNVINAITNSILLNKIHHAFLLYGTRGTGKTSTARILAKTLNCYNVKNENACRICKNCIDIENNKFLDLIEVDAASKTKVEDIKELLENTQYHPIQGKFKIYLIDEIHMLSKHSFNALLKNLEEPPNHVKFILATTNIKKIPKTIISRCLLLNFKPIHESKIFQTIKDILIHEKIIFEDIAINNISIYANGSLRDGLSLTEHAISIGKGNITNKIILQITGNINDQQTIELLSALIKKDISLIMNIINTLSILQPNWDKILLNILRLLHHIAMIQSFSLKWNISDIEKEEKKIIVKLANSISPIKIRQYYQELLIGRKEIKYSPTAKIGFEMSILRLLNIKNVNI